MPQSGEPLFAWKEVNCFLRPQALMCDRVSPHQGLLLLFLESMHRTWGLDGYFIDADKRHFQFVTAVLPRHDSVAFALTRIDRREEVMPRIRQLLNDGPVLVPANLRGSPLSSDGDDADVLHYFIVTGSSSDSGFTVFDNLREPTRADVPRYAPLSLQEEGLARMVDEYWRAYVDDGQPTHHGETGYWLLQVRAGNAGASDERAVLQRIVRAYEHELGDLDGASKARFFDIRHAERWTTPMPDGTLDAIRAYLSEANRCGVHLKILEHAVRRLDGATADDLSDRLSRYAKRSTALRTEVMVTCLMAQADRRGARAVAEELWDLAFDLRRGIRDAIRGIAVDST